MIIIYEAKVKINSFEEFKDLFTKIDKLMSQVDAEVGRQSCDAKSVMGFIDICMRCEPVTLRCNEICDKELDIFKEIVSKYEVAE